MMNCLPSENIQTGGKTGTPFEPGREIKISTDNGTETYDFLVVACDPQDGLKEHVMTKTETEKKIFSKDIMKSFIFQTTQIKVPKTDNDDPESSVNAATSVFNPARLDETKGLFHSYRSETRKAALDQTRESNTDVPMAYFKNIMSKVKYEYLTTYQFVDPVKNPQFDCMTEKEIEDKLWEMLKKELCSTSIKSWFPYDGHEAQKVLSYHTKYFNHFTIEALDPSNNKPNNWDLLKMQGNKNTIYVHASATFESVLHIYEYINLLEQCCKSSFPSDKNSRIAVVGGGPSGLLISRKLSQEMGYTDITVYESKSKESILHAGKTQTNLIDQLDKNVTNELGTCYISPDYFPMVDDFKKTGLYSKGQRLVDIDPLKDGPIVKGIATDQQFDINGPVYTLFTNYPDSLELETPPGSTFPTFLDFDEYMILKGFEEVYKGQNLSPVILKEKWKNFMRNDFLPAANKYITYHHTHYGSEYPFPTIQDSMKTEIFTLEIYDFLKQNDFMCLFGMLQYGYSVQGYGSIQPGSKISAVYLLMWVKPDMVLHSLKKQQQKNRLIELCNQDPINSEWCKKSGGKMRPLVAGFSKGWGDIWMMLKKQFDEKNEEKVNAKKVIIKYGNQITSITRADVAE